MSMDQNNGTVYCRDFLVGIGNFVLHHKQLRILPFDTIKTDHITFIERPEGVREVDTNNEEIAT